MADLKENQMGAKIAKYLRCLDSTGNSGVIGAEQFFIQIEGLCYKRQLQNPTDLNDIKETGIYYITPTAPVNAPYSYCQLLVFTSAYVTSQVAINSGSAEVSIRILWASDWSEWRKL